MLSHVERRDYAFLMVHDQLRRERAAGRAFVGFEVRSRCVWRCTHKCTRRGLTQRRRQESELRFPPTYRMLKGREGYSNKKNQSPSYTDRVLWRSAEGLRAHVECVEYNAAHGLLMVRSALLLHVPWRSFLTVALCP